MNIKEIFRNITDTIKRKRGKQHPEEAEGEEEEALEDLEGVEEELSPEQKEEMDIDTPEGQKSMLKGDHGKIFGVSRPVVIGIAVFFFVVFALAFIFASSDNKSSQKPAQQKDQTTQIADNMQDKNGDLSDDYGALHRANEKKKGAVGANQPGKPNNANTVRAQRTTASTAPAENTVSTTPTVSQVPRASVVVPSSMPAPMPSYARSYSLPSESSSGGGDEAPAAAPSKVQTIEKELKDSLSSAIAFFGGESGSGASSSGSLPADTSAAPSATDNSSVGGFSEASYSAYSDTTLTAGTLIPVMLLTGINSDSPGQVAAQVLADVYDASGTNLLIPAGSRVLGKTGSISADTGRVGVTFDTLVMPDGGSWNVGESFAAVDGMGYSGIQGTVHKHTGSNLMRGIFNSAMSALSTINVDRVTLDGSAIVGLKDTVSPTTTVDPGYQFQIYTTQNISF